MEEEREEGEGEEGWEKKKGREGRRKGKRGEEKVAEEDDNTKIPTEEPVSTGSFFTHWS